MLQRSEFFAVLRIVEFHQLSAAVYWDRVNYNFSEFLHINKLILHIETEAEPKKGNVMLHFFIRLCFACLSHLNLTLDARAPCKCIYYTRIG